MTSLLYHTKALVVLYFFVNSGLSDTEALFNILIKSFALDKTFVANPENKWAVVILC